MPIFLPPTMLQSILPVVSPTLTTNLGGFSGLTMKEVFLTGGLVVPPNNSGVIRVTFTANTASPTQSTKHTLALAPLRETPTTRFR